MGYNLNKISDAPSADVEIKDPETGAPLGVFFTMAGPEHPKRKAIDFARQRKIRASLQKTGKMELGDPEDDAQANIDLLAASTLAWRGLQDDSGAEIAFSPTAAATLFSDDEKGWLRFQLLTAMNERERFIKRSATA